MDLIHQNLDRIMPIATAYSLNELLAMLGEAGRYLADIDTSEGAAGNLSLCLRGELDPRELFPVTTRLELPLAVPALAGATLLVSGSGRRLREIKDDPQGNIACLVVEEDGLTARQFTAKNCHFTRVTSEFNSHLAVHYDQVLTHKFAFHAIIHVQPVHLTYLSHIERYQDEPYLNTHLLRWQPETILNMPEGIGFMPFQVPGSTELMSANAIWARNHRLVVWAKHGVMSRSDQSLMHAVDLVEYAETAARYEFMNLTAGEPASGLCREELRAVCEANNINQEFF
jgi:rhamnulose-1-phosphate aldolase